MANKIVINGSTVTCVYDDRIRGLLEAIGVMDIQRASHINYEPATGDFVATHIATGQEIGRGKLRNEVIQQEIKWLEGRF